MYSKVTQLYIYLFFQILFPYRLLELYTYFIEMKFMNYSSKKLLFKKICECVGVYTHHVAYIKFTLEISQEEIHAIWMKKM